MGEAVEDAIRKMQAEITRMDAAAAKTARAQAGYAAQSVADAQEQQRLEQEQRDRERVTSDRIAASRNADRAAARREQEGILDARARKLVREGQGDLPFTQRVPSPGVSPATVQERPEKGRAL